MAMSASRKNSTIVRYARLLTLRARFAAGSWLRPGATLRRAYDLFCTPLARTRRRAAAIDPAGARISEFTHGGERLREEVVEGLAVLEAALELGGLRLQLVVGELVEVGLERVDLLDEGQHLADEPLVAGPEDLLEEGADGEHGC